MAAGDKINHLSIFERDNWICGICRTLIDRNLRQPHPMCASVDHIVPLSWGGFHIAENVQAAHLRCNLEKGDGLTPCVN